MLSNLDLIREFVDQSVRKRDVLLSNSTFVAQTVHKTNQLTAKSEGVIMTVELSSQLAEFSVQAKSSHWELMNEAVAEYNYALKGEIDHRGFYRYKYCEVPKGYEMHCTKSVLLWRAWWRHRKNLLRTGIPLDLLIRNRESWYPVRDLSISDGLLYIKTLGSEIAVHSEDLLIWLSKIDANSSQESVESA